MTSSVAAVVGDHYERGPSHVYTEGNPYLQVHPMLYCSVCILWTQYLSCCADDWNQTASETHLPYHWWVAWLQPQHPAAILAKNLKINGCRSKVLAERRAFELAAQQVT